MSFEMTMRRPNAAPARSPGAVVEAGFTLVEMLVTLTILAILAAIAVPSFNEFTLRSKLNSVANGFVASAHLARSEAIKRNTAVTLCASSDGESCSGTWEDGWIVLAGDVVVEKRPAMPAGFVLSSDETSLDFQPSGVGSTSTDLTLCRAEPSVGSHRKLISVSATGRPSTTSEASASCP